MPLFRLNFSAYLRNRAGGLRTLASALALVLAGGAAAAQDTLVAYVPEPAVVAPRAVEIGSPDLLSKWRPLGPVVAAAAAGSVGPGGGAAQPRRGRSGWTPGSTRVRYGSDMEIWGVEDFWARSGELLRPWRRLRGFRHRQICRTAPDGRAGRSDAHSGRLRYRFGATIMPI